MPRRQSQAASSRNRNAVKDSSLCQFPFNDGRRCRMLRHPGHPSLCIFHARAELQLLESDRLGAELAQTLTGDYMTATDVNHILGKLYTAVAQNRVSSRNAATLAYIGQLLLTSVGGIKSEFKFSYNFEQWNQMSQKATMTQTVSRRHWAGVQLVIDRALARSMRADVVHAVSLAVRRPGGRS